MKRTVTKIHCDIDDCKVELHENRESIKMQTIFTTEQTEGRSTEPYFSFNNLDLCDKCLKLIKSGKYVFAHGAQGHNTFYIKKVG